MGKYILIITLLAVLSKLYLKLAEKYKIVDRPNERSSHDLSTIRGGGILFLIAIWFFAFSTNFKYPYLLLGVSFIGIVSFIDDIKILNFKVRLFSQFIAITLILLEAGLIQNPLWLVVLILIFGVGFINSYNFMDGINGITGLYSLSVLLGFYLINLKENIVDTDLLLFMFFALIIFGYYNFRKKARFFAGDVGSISIATVFFFVGVLLMVQLKAPVLPLLVVVYGVDSCMTIFYRKSVGEHITEPHRYHIYQKMVDIKKYSHLKISIIYAILQCAVSLIVYKSYKLPVSQQYLILVGIISLLVGAYVALFLYLKKEGKKVHKFNFEENELKYIKKVFDESQKFPIEGIVPAFEREISKFLGIKKGIALSSGTAAIHLALKVLGVKIGDTVICSTFTFVASAFPIKYIGAKPIFVDSEKDTFNMCPFLLEKAIKTELKKQKKPKAIILVHTYGNPAKIHEILEIANKYEIPILEDTAQAMGASYKNKKCGTFGKIGVFSFNINKAFTAYGGGMLISENENLLKKAKYLSSQAKEDKLHYEHLEIGYNYKINIFSAAMGLSQIENIKKEIKARKKKYIFYRDKLSKISEITFLSEFEYSTPNHWQTCILTDSEDQKKDLIHALNINKIGVRPLWKPMHQQPVFKGELCYLNGISNELFKKGITLPTNSGIKMKTLNIISKIIKSKFE